MPKPAGGRPSVGPKIETRVDVEDLARLDADANRQRVTRAEWLRNAVRDALPDPYLAAPGRRALTDVLGDFASHADLREWALNPEADRQERITAAERYAGTIDAMRTMLGELRASLPRQEARSAYVQADAADPGMERPETARAWAEAEAADLLDRLLDAVGLLLPVDGVSVQSRAEDPTVEVD